jgi:ABC-2 type transport system ATP-binding protein
MISIQNLSKSYGGVPAVDGISLEIPPGQILGLLGPNGAGKSTTLRILTGYLKPGSGTVLVKGLNVNTQALQVKNLIGYLPESAPLYGEMLVYDYLDYVADLRGVTADKKNAEIRRLSKLCGILPVMHKTISALSKGYRQRLGVAQALLSRPDLLVLDEPTAGLDPKQIVEIRALIRNFGKRYAVLVSSHILSEIAEICERTLIIHDGRLVKDSDVGELGGPGGDVERLRIRMTGSQKDAGEILGNIRGALSSHCVGTEEAGSTDWEIEYSRKDGDLRHVLFDEIAKAGKRLLMSRPCETNIEDAFLKLTADDR